MVCCASCGADGAGLRCSRCKSEHYCNVTCQRERWSSHKRACGKIALGLDMLGAQTGMKLLTACLNGDVEEVRGLLASADGRVKDAAGWDGSKRRLDQHQSRSPTITSTLH